MHASSAAAGRMVGHQLRRLAADETTRRRQPRPDSGTLRPARRSIPSLAFFAATFLITLWAGAAIAAEPSPTNPDWPCVQHKVATLTAAQMWDGPPVDGLTQWRSNDEIGKLIPVLASRRVPLEKAAAAIEAFAAAQPQETRDEALKLLFAGLLKTINDDRAIVMRGIERFQKRQRARAAEIERQGEVVRKLRERAATNKMARAELSKAQELYNWDVRVFRERQEAVPIACEIPVLIEQRLFALAREIRLRMQE